MDPSLWGLIGLISLLVIKGVFSATRTALTSARRQTLREQAEEGSHQASLALSVAEDSAHVLSTFRLANLLADFLLAGLIALALLPPAAAWLARLARIEVGFSQLIGYLVLLPTSALVIFALADSLPELIVQRDPAAWALRLARPARLMVAVFRPLVALMHAARRLVTSSREGEVEGASLVTEEEIMTLVDAGEEEGAIEQDEKEMIYSIFQLDETLAREIMVPRIEIMVPRIDVVALDINTPLEEALDVIIKAGHSRIPVYEESLDHIKGLLYAKDLLEVWNRGLQSVELAALLRPALFVPESKRVSDLLRELQTAKVHMAIVIDEYGGTAGLVTIEDIVEEIVGEIFDEYDEAIEATYEAITPNEYIFDGRIDLDDFNRLLDTNLPTELGDTLGGYIYGQLGKVPEPGETIEAERLRIEVLSVVDRRIRKVRVQRISPQESPLSPSHEDRKSTHAHNGNR